MKWVHANNARESPGDTLKAVGYPIVAPTVEQSGRPVNEMFEYFKTYFRVVCIVNT